MAAKSEERTGVVPATSNRPSALLTLGQTIAAARERCGFTRDTVAKETRLPAHYLRMIEADDYSSISDQLYLLPFLRRYAGFVGLDPEEVAARFIREVQRSDVSATRMSDPITMVERHSDPWVPAAIVAGIVAVSFALGYFAYRLIWPHRTAAANPSAPVAAASAPNRPAEATAHLAAANDPRLPAGSANHRGALPSSRGNAASKPASAHSSHPPHRPAPSDSDDPEPRPLPRYKTTVPPAVP